MFSCISLTIHINYVLLHFFNKYINSILLHIFCYIARNFLLRTLFFYIAPYFVVYIACNYFYYVHGRE
jgi:hypothetical protein